MTTQELIEFIRGCADRISEETDWHKEMRRRYHLAADRLAEQEAEIKKWQSVVGTMTHSQYEQEGKLLKQAAEIEGLRKALETILQFEGQLKLAENNFPTALAIARAALTEEKK